MKDFIYDGRIYYSRVELAMAFIGGTWKIPVLLALSSGNLRYRDLRNAIPHISDKMLHTELRDLEKKGMVTRESFREKPPRVDYGLTPLGRSSLDTIAALDAFGEHLAGQFGLEH
jgi:DNA-binding HxlR family transcriptional regulator